ncbi:MAG: Cytotoxic translational repressor of toxin-antitoxin stability system [Candidatus Amesbacteria bacterium GW2011_GWC1_46_24]|nr:MAG: Cytotoxic translational repressor of toxin-antitoxin stability system [Candidatus Amesbacteria bacterium GW2011_GWC1_46_24]
MEIIYKASAFKQLKKIPKTELKKIRNKLEAIKNDPYAGKVLKGELQGFYSVKPWPYRIIYKIVSKQIVVVSVSHRQGSYK